MKDVLWISDLSGPRFELALEQLAGGPGFVFNDVWFRLEDGSATLCCEAVSHGRTFAGRDIARAKNSLRHVRESSPEFVELVAGKVVRFSAIDFAGHAGTVELCREVGGEIKWLVEQ